MYQKAFIAHKRFAIAAAVLLIAGTAGSAHADALKCRRTIAKNAAGFEAKKIKAMQKCNDGLLNGKVMSCPDAKATDKINKALAKLNDKIGGDCAGLTLAEMNFEGLASQCNLGFTPDLPCAAPEDCAGTCASGFFQGDPCSSDGFCRGYCGLAAAGAACTSDVDCVGMNEQCSDGFCRTAEFPARSCNSDFMGMSAPCNAGFPTCYEEGLGCDNEGECNPVNFCPSVQNDSKSEPFGLDDATDCYFPLTDETDVADCVSCVGAQTVDQLIATYFDTANPPSADGDVLKCQRTLGKSAAKHFAKVRKAMQKCQDGVLKAGMGSCPDAKATDKINKSVTKTLEKITGTCTQALLDQGFVVSELAARFGRPDLGCLNVSGAVADVVAAIECLTAATANQNDQLGIGSSTGANSLCGNQKLDAGETCDDGNQLQESGVGPADVCPADCAIAACTDAGDQGVTVNFTSPADLTGLTVVLYYDESKVSIPGQNSDPPVVAAIGGVNFAPTPFDTNYALRNVLTDPSLIGVPSGEAFTVTFDTCMGAPAPVAGDFSCFVADASDVNSVAVAGVTCSVTVP